MLLVFSRIIDFVSGHSANRTGWQAGQPACACLRPAQAGLGGGDMPEKIGVCAKL